MKVNHPCVLSTDDIVEFNRCEFHDLQISPNGRYVLAVLGNYDLPYKQYFVDKMERKILRICVEYGETKQLTALYEDGHAPAWSPDSKSIIYLSRKSGKTALWKMNADGSAKSQLTHLTSPAKNPFAFSQLSWSPCGRFIAYTFFPNGGPQELRSSQELGSSANNDEIVVETWQDEKHKLPDELISELRIFELDSKNERRLASLKGKTFNILRFMPDGKSIVVNAGGVLQIISVDKENVQTLCTDVSGLVYLSDDGCVYLAKVSDNRINVSILEEGDFKQKRAISVPYQEIRLHAWSKDGSTIHGTAQKGVRISLFEIKIASCSFHILTPPEKTVGNRQERAKPTISEDGKSLAFILSDATHPTEVFLKEEDMEIRKLTKINRRIDDILLGEVKTISYKSDGWDIEGLLVLPVNYRANLPCPTLFYLHGGPEQAISASFTELISARGQSAAHFFAGKGYAIFLPNFRGSAGYSDSFKQQLANYNLMVRPYRDVIAGVEHLVKKGIADPERLAIYGHSFGARLTAWVIAHRTCFKCALGVVGRYDMLYMARATGTAFHTAKPNRQGDADPMDTWLYPEVYKMLSPIEHIKNVKTPMLLIETKAERRLWGSEGRPYFNGLKALGVPSYLVYYPKAFHTGGWNDQYKRDYLRRALAWFDCWLKSEPLPDWFQE